MPAPFFPEKVAHILTSRCRQKAVSEGTILWHLSQALEARAVRFTYGVPICLPYDPESSLQQGRHTYVSLDGIRRVSGFWSTIIPKVRGLHLQVFPGAHLSVPVQGTIMKTSEPIESWYFNTFSFASCVPRRRVRLRGDRAAALLQGPQR